MWPFGMKPKPSSDPVSLASCEVDENNPLNGVRVEGESFVFDDVPEVMDLANEGDEKTAQRIEKLRSLYPEEKFHKHFCRVLNRVGRSKGLSSLEISQDDEDMRDACAIVYRRLANSALAPAMEFISDDAFEDVMVLSFAFGPLAWNVYEEVQAKRKTQNVQFEETQGMENGKS